MRRTHNLGLDARIASFFVVSYRIYNLHKFQYDIRNYEAIPCVLKDLALAKYFFTYSDL